MDDLTMIARYGKEHGMTYGEVQMLLYMGRLTMQQIRLECKPVPPEPKAREKKTPETRGRKKKHAKAQDDQ